MFILFLVRFWVLSGHLLGKSCSLCRPVCYLCNLTICNFSYIPFVLIASVPGLCILFTFTGHAGIMREAMSSMPINLTTQTIKRFENKRDYIIKPQNASIQQWRLKYAPLLLPVKYQ